MKGGTQNPNLPRRIQQQSLRFSWCSGDSDPLFSAELFQLDYIGVSWCMNCPFKVTSRLWLDPAGMFCCRTQVFFSLRQWSDIQMFSISIFRYNESQCLVPPDHHNTSIYDWRNSAEAQWFWLLFSPMLPFLSNFISTESWILTLPEATVL